MIFTKTIIEAIKHWVNGRLTNYVEIVKGKGLSTEDYTSEEKEKLSTVQAGAEKNAQPDWNEIDETQDSFILNKPDKVCALELVSEMGVIEPVADENGAILTDENGSILTI